ncbi:MAG: site-specific integrase [Gammaproteobacteria bacterium]|nr:site-specific integrase [Gammaproteobacteria bacterium]
MKRNIFDQVVERRVLGDWPIAEIKIRHVVEVLQQMEDQGLVESLHRCRQKLVHIFNRAIVLELREDNPVLPLTKEFKPRRRNVPGLIALPWRTVGQFQRDIDASDAFPLTKLAMKFMLLTIQRSSEMRGATWDEIDRDRALWTIQASRMKGNKNAREDQLVPLSTHALDVLEQISQLELSNEYIFPVQQSGRAKHAYMSENTLQKFCDELGYKGKMHVHGLRKTFSTQMNGLRHAFNSKIDTDAIEMCLDHYERDAMRGTYNHAEHLGVRTEIMQTWAVELEKERESSVNKVVPIRRTER